MNHKERLKNYDELPLVLDVADIQRVMGISRASAYELVHSPSFPSFRSGRLIKVSKQAFFDWMARSREKGGCAINTNRERSGTAVLYRCIGSTTYKLRVHLSDTAQETIDDKILHLLQYEAVTNPSPRGTMTVPQMSQPLEGSSA